MRLDRIDRSQVGAKKPLVMLTAVLRQVVGANEDADHVHTIDGELRISSLDLAAFDALEAGAEYFLELRPAG